MKSIEQMFSEKQKRIAEAIKNKTIRQSKTEMSIGFRWSVNVAVSFLPEKLRGTKKGFNQLKKWQLEFENWDREFMLENIVIEPTKLVAEDFVMAREEAPKSESEQLKAEELGAEKLSEDKEREANEALDLQSQPPEEGSNPIMPTIQQ